jgi:hypothetical protein
MGEKQNQAPATAIEAWEELAAGRVGPAVKSYLGPGPEPRYDTPEARAAAEAETEAEAGQ